VYETVTIPDALPLGAIAEWAEVPVEALKELNPGLRRGITPTTSYELKVPVGTAASIQTQLESHSDFLKFRFHQVRAGETLATIARKYGFTTKQLRDANDLRSSRVTRNQPIMIPAAAPRAVPTTARPAPSGSSAAQVYRVRPGDTLYSIARQFDTTIETLKRVNQLASDRIKAGDRLSIPR
jgi:membrane-bound lytic murein transglycosylase D